jgi:DNA-binding IscR family transcriptional regulator
MLRISKMTDYAIMVMVELYTSSGEVLSAHALAERSHLELPTVSKVLKLLVKTGLVDSYRGAWNATRGVSAWPRSLPPSRGPSR